MNSQYVKPGIAAIALALLFPIYWSSVFIFGPEGDDLMSAMRNEVQTFSGFDVLFIVIGALEIYLYLSLAKAVEEQLNSSSVKLLLMIMVGTVAIFHGLVLVDVFLMMASGAMTHASIDSVVATTVILSIIALVVFTVTGLIFSIVLLTKTQQMSPMLKAFSILLLVVCLLQLTVFFAVINIILFPVALIVLAAYFLKDPETLEVV